MQLQLHSCWTELTPIVRITMTPLTEAAGELLLAMKGPPLGARSRAPGDGGSLGSLKWPLHTSTALKL